MKYIELKKGQTVRDRWYDSYGLGEVKVVLKTVVHIKFTNVTWPPHGIISYDKSHVQFLEEVINV
jgi:hypothetical protein